MPGAGDYSRGPRASATATQIANRAKSVRSVSGSGDSLCGRGPAYTAGPRATCVPARAAVPNR